MWYPKISRTPASIKTLLAHAASLGDINRGIVVKGALLGIRVQEESLQAATTQLLGPDAWIESHFNAQSTQYEIRGADPGITKELLQRICVEGGWTGAKITTDRPIRDESGFFWKARALAPPPTRGFRSGTMLLAIEIAAPRAAKAPKILEPDPKLLKASRGKNKIGLKWAPGWEPPKEQLNNWAEKSGVATKLAAAADPMKPPAVIPQPPAADAAAPGDGTGYGNGAGDGDGDNGHGTDLGNDTTNAGSGLFSGGSSIGAPGTPSIGTSGFLGGSGSSGSLGPGSGASFLNSSALRFNIGSDTGSLNETGTGSFPPSGELEEWDSMAMDSQVDHKIATAFEQHERTLDNKLAQMTSSLAQQMAAMMDAREGLTRKTAKVEEGSTAGGQ